MVTPSIQAKVSYDDNVHFDKKSDFEWAGHPVGKGGLRPGELDPVCRWAGRCLSIFRPDDFMTAKTTGCGSKGRRILRGPCGSTATRLLITIIPLRMSWPNREPSRGRPLRRRYSLSPGISWGFSEKDSLSLSLPYSQSVYTGSDNADLVSKGGTLTWSHVLNNERTSILAQGILQQLLF